LKQITFILFFAAWLHLLTVNGQGNITDDSKKIKPSVKNNTAINKREIDTKKVTDTDQNKVPYQVINGRKVLVDNQGNQSLVNPEMKDTSFSRIHKPGE
jgi:hypothetical protein